MHFKKITVVMCIISITAVSRVRLDKLAHCLYFCLFGRCAGSGGSKVGPGRAWALPTGASALPTGALPSVA